MIMFGKDIAAVLCYSIFYSHMPGVGEMVLPIDPSAVGCAQMKIADVTMTVGLRRSGALPAFVVYALDGAIPVATFTQR